MGLQKNIVVSPCDGFDAWHRATCREFSVTECRRVPDDQFKARVSVGEFGPLTINEICYSTSGPDRIKVTRSASDIRKDPRDYFMLWLLVGGCSTFAQNGREVSMRKGDLVLHDQAQPFMLEFGRYSRSAMISIARPLVCDRLPHASDLTARRIPARSKLAPFAGSIVRHLMQLNDLTDSTARQISVSALDVFTTMLELELTNREESTSNRAGLEQAKRFIMANLGDASLTLEAISRAQQIAPRTLTRLFAREGTTPIRWLWQQRLAASYRALAEGRIDRVTDAALAFGFNDLSHFSRSFKAAFGRSPQTFKSKK